MSRLHDVGQRSIESLEAQRLVEVERERAEAARSLSTRIDKADNIARRLLGDEAPPRSAWRDFGGGSLIAPLGGAIGERQSDGEDGQLILHHGVELWYRPRFTNGSARIRDYDHLGRMVVGRNIYS